MDSKHTYKTRSETVQAVQWAGTNIEEVQAWLGSELRANVKGNVCQVHKGRSLRFTLNVGKWLVCDWTGEHTFDDDAFKIRYILDHLVRTVEDYTNLPGSKRQPTILQVIKPARDAGLVLAKDSNEAFFWAGAFNSWSAEKLVRRCFVCRVVEYGGTT